MATGLATSEYREISFSLGYLLKNQIHENDTESSGVHTWRMTAGRINELAQIPLNFLSSLATLAKVVLIKIPFVAISLNNSQKLHKNLSIKGIKNDLNKISDLFSQSILNSILFVVGPSQDYQSFQSILYSHGKDLFKI